MDAGAARPHREKGSTKKRPLGIPTWSDKLLQEVVRHNATLSGSPQGAALLPKHNRGDRRRCNPAWIRLRGQATRLEKAGRQDEADLLRRQMKQVPCLDPMDPAYRRLRYVRYADDWLLGFSGPRCEAEAIKREVAAFLRDSLKLELS